MRGKNLNVLNVYYQGRLEITCYGAGAIPYQSIQSLAENGRIFKWNGEKLSAKQVMELNPDKPKPKKTDITKPIQETKVQEDITKPRNTRSKRKIYCKELNKTFESASIAAKELNINPAQISAAISKQKSVRGYTFTVSEE